jgi:hypothetical protein
VKDATDKAAEAAKGAATVTGEKVKDAGQAVEKQSRKTTPTEPHHRFDHPDR